MGRPGLDPSPASAPARSNGPRLTFRRLAGLDRSGPPPAATQPGAPLNPWTIPNAIGMVRLALLPVFVAWAWQSESGTDVGPAIIYAIIGWSDYLDGIAARVTGQYSRFGAMLDPVVDRLLVVCGVAVCWHFDLLPRWLLAIMFVREVLMLYAGQLVVRRNLVIKINWTGRWAVWPTMSAIFFALCGLRELGTVLLAIGATLSVIATLQYSRRIREMRSEPEPST